jgi:hypothetical protein
MAVFHLMVEDCLIRFERDRKRDYKAMLAAGGRCIASLWIYDYEHAYVLTLSFDDFPIPPDHWQQYAPPTVMANLSYMIASARAGGDESLTPQPPDRSTMPTYPEAGELRDALFCGLAFITSEKHCPHDDDDDSSAECPDPEVSDSIYLSCRNGNVYVRRYLGTARAETIRGFIDIETLDPAALVAALRDPDNAFSPRHAGLMGLCRTIVNPPQMLAEELKELGSHEDFMNAVTEVGTDLNAATGHLDPADPRHPSRLN